jgi:hypothetical protein
VAAGNLGNLISRLQDRNLESMPPGMQRYKRIKMVLPLRFWPDDENTQNLGPQLAHTVDISPIGGRLGGLRVALLPGQTILLERGQTKSRFRVVWTRQLGPGETQAGIESVAFEKTVWGVELPDQLTSPGGSHARDNPPGVPLDPPNGP